MGSPCAFQRRKEGRFHMCIDNYNCTLNHDTVKHAYPMPKVDEFLQRLHDYVVLTKLDFKSGYHQVCMSEGDVQKATFGTQFSAYEFLVTPFGLCNAPALFSMMMTPISYGTCHLCSCSWMIYWCPPRIHSSTTSMSPKCYATMRSHPVCSPRQLQFLADHSYISWPFHHTRGSCSPSE
jgi:hypothetical protein